VRPSIDSLESLDLPPFRPRFPWWSADLQTIAVLLGTYESDLSPHKSERVCVAHLSAEVTPRGRDGRCAASSG